MVRTQGYICATLVVIGIAVCVPGRVAAQDTKAPERPATPEPPPPFTGPDDLKAEPFGRQEVRLTWDAVDGAARYRVRRRAITDDAWKDIFDAPATIMLFHDRKDLTAGDTYEYRVTAVRGTDSNLEEESTGATEIVQIPRLAAEKLSSDCYAQAVEGSRFDCSHVMVSAIRSIAGKRPSNEWASLQFKFSGNDSARRGFALLYADLNINDSTEDQDLASFFNDATFSWNLWIGKDLTNPIRGTFVGPVIKVFDRIPFFGAQLGGLERVQSRFHGSYVALMPMLIALRDRFPNELPSDATAVDSANQSVAHRTNTLLEFSLRADDGPAFFQAFAARIAVMVPWTRAEDPVMRVVLLVPIGGVFPFQ